MNSPVVAERGRRRRVGAQLRRLQSQGQLAAGDFAVVRVDQHQRDADPGRSRRREPLRVAPLWRSASRSSDATPSRTSSRRGMGDTDASGVTRYTVDPGADRGQALRVARARRNERRGRSVVERDGLHDRRRRRHARRRRGAAPSTGPRPPDPPPGVRLPLPDMLRSCSRRLQQRQPVVPARPEVHQQPVAGSRDRRIPPDRLALGLQRQADQDRRRQRRRSRRPPPATKRRITTAADRTRVRPKCTWSTCWSATAAPPTLTWRVFTGEEPGFWTGAGRF